jgi:hypothetical protein
MNLNSQLDDLVEGETLSSPEGSPVPPRGLGHAHGHGQRYDLGEGAVEGLDGSIDSLDGLFTQGQGQGQGQSQGTSPEVTFNPFDINSPKGRAQPYRHPSKRKGSRRGNMHRRSSFPTARGTFTEDAFQERMAAVGMHVVEMEMDGNCLFHAVAHQVYMDESRDRELRERVVAHMLLHRTRYEPFCSTDFDQYLSKMSRPGSWADDLEIRALEEVLDRIIVIYSSESKTCDPMETNFDEQLLMKGADDVAPIRISYHGQSHYNSIFDEKTPLPLPHRTTTVLLDSRVKAFMGD